MREATRDSIIANRKAKAGRGMQSGLADKNQQSATLNRDGRVYRRRVRLRVYRASFPNHWNLQGPQTAFVRWEGKLCLSLWILTKFIWDLGSKDWMMAETKLNIAQRISAAMNDVDYIQKEKKQGRK